MFSLHIKILISHTDVCYSFNTGLKLIFGLGTTILSEHMKSNYDLIDETVVMQFTTMQEGSLPF